MTKGERTDARSRVRKSKRRGEKEKAKDQRLFQVLSTQMQVAGIFAETRTHGREEFNRLTSKRSP